MLSDNNNSFKNVIHNLSRYKFVNRVSPHIFTQPHPKRLNLGGCVLKESDVNVDFTNSPVQLSELLISYMEGKEFDKEIMKDFIQCLNRLQYNAPYRSKHVPNATGGANIMNRLIAVSQFNAQKRAKEWSNAQIQFIDKMLLTRANLFTNENIILLQCTELQLKSIIELRVIELSKRQFTFEEDAFVMQHLSDKMKNKDIANTLICRTINDIKKRRNALKKMIKAIQNDL